jgi:predicted Zn finger-like uncharacterized protein
MIITCPKCSSKFKVDDALKEKTGVKMRCSVCSNIFSPFDDTEHLIKPSPDNTELEKSSSPKPDTSEEQAPLDTGLTFTQEEKQETPQTPEPAAEKKSNLKNLFKGLIVMLIIAIALILSYNKGAINLFNRKNAEQAQPEQSFAFTIKDSDTTFKNLTNKAQEHVFLIKGIVRKNEKKPLKTLMIEVRILDKDKNPLAVKTVYAGNLPSDSDFEIKTEAEIDAMLMDGTKPLGVLSEVDEIPYCAAFFGEKALKATSIQSEVKEYIWEQADSATTKKAD